MASAGPTVCCRVLADAALHRGLYSVAPIRGLGLLRGRARSRRPIRGLGLRVAPARIRILPEVSEPLGGYEQERAQQKAPWGKR